MLSSFSVKVEIVKPYKMSYTISIVISIFVEILVELTNTAFVFEFVNSTNTYTSIEAAMLSTHNSYRTEREL